MKDRILFWIDVDFIYFGIAKYMQEKYDFDSFAIIDVNGRAKKFFQDQKLVQFQKAWYYLDYISLQNKQPDIDYLKYFESKYKIQLWNIAYSERSFHKYNIYYNFSSNEILSIIEQECKFFENVLNEVKPDFLIIKMTDWHQNHLLYEMCKARGIKILMLIPTRFGIRMMISERIDKVDSILSKTDLQTKRTVGELENYLKGYDSFKQANEFRNKYQIYNWQKFKTTLRFFLTPINSSYRKRYSNYKATRSKIFVKQLRLLLKKRYREFFINRYFTREITNETPFIYFPMHIEPERTLSIDAPYYTNQLEVITNIAKSLPVGYKLYVKEHTVMKNMGWRSISYYKQILELPNVKLIHPSVKPEEMFSNCSLVITITGTAGLEAAFYKKPAILLADVIYSSIPSVYRLKSIEVLPQAIQLSLQKKVDPLDLNEFVDTIDKNSFEFDINRLRTDFSNRYYYGGMLVDPNMPISKIESFIAEYEEVFRRLALEHIKKIQQYKETENKIVSETS